MSDSYNIGDAVSHELSSYASLIDANTGHEPSGDTDTYWMIIAHKGEPGTMSGPVSSTDGHFAQWDGAGGNSLKDGGYGPTEFDAKAPLASPAFTGNPTVPTQSAGNNSTRAASTAFVYDALDNKTNVQTGDYVAALSDNHKTIEMNVGSDNTCTIPPNSDVSFEVGSWFNIMQVGAGQTTIQAGSGVTLRARIGVKLAGQYAIATVYQRAGDEWHVSGDVIAA
jgi:hypothetical protein